MSRHSHPRRSPVYRRVSGGVYAATNEGAFATAPGSPAKGADLTMADLSVLPRWGVKGREAFARIEEFGAEVPAADNRAIVQQDHSLVARLSPGELLILPTLQGKCYLGPKLDGLPEAGAGACYPVPRRDSHCWFIVSGPSASTMFAKLCAVDLMPNYFPHGHIAQTSVARLSAIVIRDDIGDLLNFHLLAESASAEYLWDCLLDAMGEFSGAIVLNALEQTSALATESS